VTAEIMCVVADEARDSYPTDIVHEVPSNSPEDMAANVERTVAWYQQWVRDNAGEAGDGAAGGAGGGSC